MARNKGTSKAMSLDFHDLEEMMKRYEKIGADIKPAAEKALKKSHDYVTRKLKEHTTKPYMPAGGKYSRGDTEKSIVEDDKVYWIGGTQAFIGVGYDVSKELTSVFLMYGTPKMDPMKEIYQDVWGRNTRRLIREIQEETMWDCLNELRGG